MGKNHPMVPLRIFFKGKIKIAYLLPEQSVIETIIFCKLYHFWAALWTKKIFPFQNHNFWKWGDCQNFKVIGLRKKVWLHPWPPHLFRQCPISQSLFLMASLSQIKMLLRPEDKVMAELLAKNTVHPLKHHWSCQFTDQQRILMNDKISPL